MRKLYTTIAGIFFCFSLLATGDSLRYLTPKDTVFLKANEYGQKIFGHRMVKGQTLYSLSRFYGLRPESLLAINPNLSPDGSFTQGQAIDIPIPDSAIVKSWKAALPRKEFAPIYYQVKPGDTFFRISKSMFQLPVDTLKARNRLTTTTVHTGQLLLIGWLSTSGIPESLQARNANPLGNKMFQLQSIYNGEKARKTPKFQNGAAYWQREKKGSRDYYALHRFAPVGSVIQITNPMRGKTVYAEVIAPIPDRAYGNDIIVVISPSIAKQLGAKDPKFFVEVRYF